MINVDMPTKEGVTLATSGKYCEDNIKVTPSFEVEDSQSNALIQYSDYDDEGYPHTLTYCPKDTNSKVPNELVGHGHQYRYSTFLSRIDNIIQPNWITEWGNGGLSVSERVTTVSGWDNLTYLGDGCFINQGQEVGTTIYGISYDHLPPNLTYIGTSCFRYPIRVNHASWTSIPDSVTYIGVEAFSYENSVKEGALLLNKLPDNLTFLGNSAFICNNKKQAVFTCKTLHLPEPLNWLGSNSLGGGAWNVERIVFDGTPSTTYQNNIKGISPNALGGNLPSLTELYVPWSEGAFTTEPFGCKNTNLVIYRYSNWENSTEGTVIEAGTSCFKYNGKLYKAAQSGILTEWNDTYFEEVE